MDKKTRPIYMLPTRDSIQTYRYMQIESEGMDKHLSRKWMWKENWDSNIILDKIDFLKMFMYFWERERACASGGEAEREGDRGSKEGPCYLRTFIPMIKLERNNIKIFQVERTESAMVLFQADIWHVCYTKKPVWPTWSDLMGSNKKWNTVVVRAKLYSVICMLLNVYCLIYLIKYRQNLNRNTTFSICSVIQYLHPWFKNPMLLGHLDGSVSEASNSWFWLRSWSHGSWDQAPNQAVCWQHRVCLGFFLSISLLLPSTCCLSLSLSLSQK